MKTRNFVMALALTLVMGTAAAGEKDRFCTPGWYKNNGLDTWYPQDDCTVSGHSCDHLLSMLNASRNSEIMSYFPDLSPGQVKNLAADLIVSSGLLFAKEETCEEVPDY